MRWGHKHMGAKFLYQSWGPLSPIKHGLKSGSVEPSPNLGCVHMLPTTTTKYVTCYASLPLYQQVVLYMYGLPSSSSRKKLVMCLLLLDTDNMSHKHLNCACKPQITPRA